MLLKRRYILPLILFVLVLLAILFRQQNSTFSKNDKVLSFANSITADRIEISTTGNNFQLIKKEDTWYTNDENTANSKMIKQLFRALENIQIQSSVLKENNKKYLSNFEETGTSLKVYSNKNLLYELKFSNYLSKNYVLTKAKNLYYISIKGFGGKLLSEFAKTNISDWYNKVLINLNSNEITSILVEYPVNTQIGFKLNNKNQNTILLNRQNKIEERANSESIDDYLHFFSGIRYSNIDTTQQIPNPNNQLFRLNINTNIAKTIHIVGFEMVDKKTLQPDMVEFVGIINNSLLVKLSYSDFDPILVELDYFLKK